MSKRKFFSIFAWILIAPWALLVEWKMGVSLFTVVVPDAAPDHPGWFALVVYLILVNILTIAAMFGKFDEDKWRRRV